MLTLFELFGVAFLFIWCGNAIPTPLFLARHSCTWPHQSIVFKCVPTPLFSTALLHMTTSTNCVQIKAKLSQHGFCLMKQNGHYRNVLCHFGPCHAHKKKVWHIA